MHEIAIVGDLHISVRISSRVDNYFEAILNKITEIANNCKHIIFLGDVFEHETIPLDYFQKMFNHFQYLKRVNNNSFYSIIGNHDIYQENETTLPRTTLGLCDLTGIIKVIKPEEVLTINGINFYTSYVSPDKCRKHLKELDLQKEDILLLHQYYEEFDGLKYEDISHLQCNKIFLGHEHKPLDNGLLTLPNTTLYRSGSVGRNKAEGFQLNRDVLYYILDEEPKLTKIECTQLGNEVFTTEAYNQVNLKKKQFIRNINEVVDKYSNNISTQDKFSIRSVLDELHTPSKCIEYINYLYDKIGEKFE